MWKDNDKIIKILDDINEDDIRFPCSCPICSGKSAHIYIHSHNDNRCGIWTWCDSCEAFSHMSGMPPKWWKNLDIVDATQLCAEPKYLNQMKDSIDEWVNSILPKENRESSKPFVMENKFNVILKENFQGISAGTTGVIVVKDSFKAIEIDFIGTDGKEIRVNEPINNFVKAIEII